MQSQTRQRKSRRVLVADDNADSADLLGMYLQLQDFEVAVAHDGSEAISVAQDFRPTIVVCDLRMPRMDGIAVAKALRSDRRRYYLIALTSLEPDDVPEHRDLFEAYFTKPADLDALVNRLELLSSLAVRADAQRGVRAATIRPRAGTDDAGGRTTG